MELCDFEHEEICFEFESSSCPLCRADTLLEELKTN